MDLRISETTAAENDNGNRGNEMTSPSDGYHMFLSETMLEWIFTAIAGAGTAVAGWVWRLTVQVAELRQTNHALRGELDAVKLALKEVDAALGRKIDTETERLEQNLDRVFEKVEETRRDLPSRAFIEGQLLGLSQRLDRSLEVKLAGR